MVDIVERLDFLKEISPHLCLKWMENKAETSTDNEETVDHSTLIDKCKPKIIGQERNGIILFTWCHPEDSASCKTMIELYSIVNKKARTLFSHEKRINVVSASVNEEQCLLAFTVRESGIRPGSSSPSNPSGIYRSFVAEIQPQYRVFSLNMEWHTCQKVSFLYGQYGSPKVSHMLFIDHKSSIGLYHIPVCKSSDGSFLMSSQPRTEEIIRKFVWCQFEQTFQRLYYLQLVSQDEEEINARGKFGAIEFQNNGTFKYMLEFYLPLHFRMDAMHQTVHYFDEYLSNTVSNLDFNMEVLTSSRSSFYICFQHVEDTMQNTNDSQEDILGAIGNLSEQGEVRYTVCCVHGGYTLFSLVTGLLPGRLPNRTSGRVFFTLFGDYLAAFLPASFLHLLDCGSEHEPVHHLFLHGRETPSLPDWNPAMNEPLLSVSVKDVAPVLHSTSMFFENKTQKQYKFELSQKKLNKLFLSTTSATQRLSLLHAALLHFKICGLTKRFIEIMCQDPSSPECTDLIKEYLLASSYDEMKRKCPLNQPELKLLPFTGVDPFRGQVERDTAGNRVVHVTYRKFTSELIDLVQNQLRKNLHKFWIDIRNCLLLSLDDQFHRFSYSLLSSNDIKLPEDTTPYRHEDTKKSLFKRFSQATNRKGSASGTNPGDGSADVCNPAIENVRFAEDEFTTLDEVRGQRTIELLNAHCNACLPRESKTKLFALCKKYSGARRKVVARLWELLLKTYKYESAFDILNCNLAVPGSQEDASLFQIIEKVTCVIWELCFQAFPNMQTISLILASRCLPTHLFLHYIESKVIHVTNQFVSRFIQDLPDSTEENVSLKVKLLTKLPKEQAKNTLQGWDHPVAKNFFAQQVMLHFYKEDISYCSLSKVQAGEHEFLPLGSLLDIVDLQLNSTSKTLKEERKTEKIDIGTIASTALCETRRLQALYEDTM